MGHHRDKDTRAGYSVLENGSITHYRVEYDIEKTIYDTKAIECLSEPFLSQWIQLLKDAYGDLIEKDIKTIAGYSAQQ